MAQEEQMFRRKKQVGEFSAGYSPSFKVRSKKGLVTL
jgi:hypothetical protein